MHRFQHTGLPVDCLERTMLGTKLPKEMLGHNPDVYMSYESRCSYQINNLEEAVKTFEKAANSKAPIYIYCDYDVDGIGSATIMKLLCDSLGIKAQIYVPDRFKDGYGLTEAFVDRMIKENTPALDDVSPGPAPLLMTFDNGIATLDQISKARAAGIEVVVMDHHLPVVNEQGEVVLPDANVVCDPHVTGGTCEDYCGAGLAYKFAQRCYEDVKKIIPERKEQILNMMCVQAAVSTIADSVPLTTENYQIVEKGLTLLSLGRCTYGMKVLAEKFNLLGKNISTSDVAFGLVAGLNAWGRLEGQGSQEVVKLLSYTQGYSDEILKLRDTVWDMNEARKELTAQAIKRAEEEVEKTGQADKNIIVIYDPECKAGLCGLAAGRLAEKYKVPCIYLTDTEGEPGHLHGSGRSFGDIDLKEMLDRTQSLLLNYGGHAAACGVGVDIKNLDEFRNAANEILPERKEMTDVIKWDWQCHAVDAVKLYGPQSRYMWGVGNPCPVTLIDDMSVSETRVMGKEGKTIKFSQKNKIRETELDILSFSGAQTYSDMENPKKIIAVGTLSDNVWKGQHTLQLLADYFADDRTVERGNRGEIISSLDVEDQEPSIDHCE